jgi:UDP-N-acetylglucosamine 2-epimerase (non-hydrolysing)
MYEKNNMKKKIMLVFGTRPEAIKMAPLVHSLRAMPDKFIVLVCVTAQHRKMLDQVLNLFEIEPEIDLNLMTKEQDLFSMTSSILIGLKKVFADHRPDIVLVHGDTTTTFVASLASFYAGIAIGHIEAGLRTHNLKAPFPEEFNRQVTSKVAQWHFAPTALCQKNLLAEGVPLKNITITGNTIIDSLHWVLKRIERDSSFRNNLITKLSKTISFDLHKEKFILITGHRRENFGNGFLNICKAIQELAIRYNKIHFVYPVHLNPQVQEPVQNILANIKNVHLIEPLAYEVFIYLMQQAFIILTDSGGIQEEAPSLGKPVLLMRDITERPESLESGTVTLVGTNQQNIVAGVSRLLEDSFYYQTMSLAHNPYGTGQACKLIVDILKKI